MKFAVAVPQLVADGRFDPEAFREYLVHVEELGFESAWVMEQVLGSASMLSPLTTMTFAAACTTQLRLGCVVFVSTLHNPVHLAKELASLDQLSRGRLEVGVGTGGRARPFATFGIADPEHYVRRFTEGVTVMKALWTRQSATVDGQYWQLSDAHLEPKPFQKPHPPLWFGGGAPTALRRAMRLGTGFFGAGSTPTAAFAEQAALVRAERPDFPIAKRVYIAVDDDGDRARATMVRDLSTVYGARIPTIESAAVAGTVDDCVAGLHEVANAGAELILLSALTDQRHQLDRLAGEVIPRLR